MEPDCYAKKVFNFLPVSYTVWVYVWFALDDSK